MNEEATGAPPEALLASDQVLRCPSERHNNTIPIKQLNLGQVVQTESQIFQSIMSLSCQVTGNIIEVDDVKYMDSEFHILTALV